MSKQGNLITEKGDYSSSASNTARVIKNCKGKAALIEADAMAKWKRSP